MADITTTINNQGASNTGPLPDASGAIVLGGTAQVLIAECAQRRYFFFQNLSAETLWINFGTTAVADKPSIQILAGASITFNVYVPGAAASVIGATTGSKFTCKVG